ncbi:MAG: tRNA threonylcarbamoyladenosine biosynthesis protein TsaE [Flavobacteriales bacterium]|jgi:tRNA threonylcarbamoyladenosine biosynthesis protein TsaE
MRKEFTLYGESKTVEFGRALAKSARYGSCVHLHGDLGAGKTTLCRGFIRSMGHSAAVKSPTYTLVEPYEFNGRQVFHFDLYRVSDPEELEYIGIRDYFHPKSLSLIEWPDKGAGMLPEPDLVLDLRVVGLGRRLTVQSSSELGREWFDDLNQVLKLTPL